MRHLLLVFSVLNSLPVFSQPYTFIPQHEYESFYRKYRREQFKTTLLQYELHGPVRDVRLIYSPEEKQARLTPDTQYFTFSKSGLLYRYQINDTDHVSEDWPGDYYSQSWQLYYNNGGELDTIRVAEHGDNYTDAYWLAYDSSGFLISAGNFDTYEDGLLAKESLHYVWISYDSCLSVTTDPFSEYDITGNVMGDTVHFEFDDFGRVTKESVYYFWGIETISFKWNNDLSFSYWNDGRSWMGESGRWQMNSAGRMLHSTANGYRIDQRGTHHFNNVDSLVYNKQGWIVAEYHVPLSLSGEDELPWHIINQELTVKLGKPAEPRMQLNRKYVYTVDSRGNWITRMQYDGNGNLIGTEKRQITYY